MFNKSYQWLDSNPGHLVSEATALPTAPQPPPNSYVSFLILTLSLSLSSSTAFIFHLSVFLMFCSLYFFILSLSLFVIFYCRHLHSLSFSLSTIFIAKFPYVFFGQFSFSIQDFLVVFFILSLPFICQLSILIKVTNLCVMEIVLLALNYSNRTREF